MLRTVFSTFNAIGECFAPLKLNSQNLICYKICWFTGAYIILTEQSSHVLNSNTSNSFFSRKHNFSMFKTIRERFAPYNIDRQIITFVASQTPPIHFCSVKHIFLMFNIWTSDTPAKAFLVCPNDTPDQSRWAVILQMRWHSAAIWRLGWPIYVKRMWGTMSWAI